MLNPYGIDLSEHQNPALIDYDKLSKQIGFVILRVGFTGWGSKTLNQDAHFNRHYEEFKKRGIPIGVYWYSCATSKAEGIEEAKKTLELICGKTITLPIWWDTEDTIHQAKTDKKTLTDTAIAFMETIENAGYFTGYYASTSWENTRLEKDRLRVYANWQAQWGGELTEKDCGVWQITSRKKLDGYGSHLDYNIAFVDYESLIRKAGLNHLVQSPYYPIPPKLTTYANSLRSIGLVVTPELMKRIALKNGIANYRFTAVQNIALLLTLRKGRLLKP